MQLLIKKYPVKHPRLKLFIKDYWLLESDGAVALRHKLLPVDTIDLILNLSDPIGYAEGAWSSSAQEKETWKKAKDFHFSGLRDRHHLISQQGKLKVMGIAFHPYGSFAFFKQPMDQFKNLTVNLEDVARELTHHLASKLSPQNSVEENLKSIEEELLLQMDISEVDLRAAKLLHEFCMTSVDTRIETFCEGHNLSIKTLERMSLKLAGVSPKALQRIKRFQQVSGQLIGSKGICDLTELTYDFHYYDQTHFIKEFKAFSGATPTQFLKERMSIKEVAQNP